LSGGTELGSFGVQLGLLEARDTRFIAELMAKAVGSN
jgi:hypothetical protein